MGFKRAVGVMGFNLLGGRFKSRFVAGSTLQDAVNRAKLLRARGEKSVINILGEHIRDLNEASRFCNQILELIFLLKKEGLSDVHIAEKPSQLGFDIAADLYRFNKFRILGAARDYLPEALIETDAEDSFYREQVIEAALNFREGCSFSNQLVCCQLNRKQALQEIRTLQSAGIPVRICKGSSAYPGDIGENADFSEIFLTAAQTAVAGGKRSAFATHDLFIIESIAERFAADKEKFEFELLMGIEENLRKEPHLQGFTFRRYITCDPNNKWRPYGKRRAETIVDIWLRNFWHRAMKGGGAYGPDTF